MFVINANSGSIYTPTMSGAAPLYSTFTSISRKGGLWYDDVTIPDDFLYPSGWRAAEASVISTAISGLSTTFTDRTPYNIANGGTSKVFSDKWVAKYNSLVSAKIACGPASYEMPNNDQAGITYKTSIDACEIDTGKHATINVNSDTGRASVTISVKSGENITFGTPSDIDDSNVTTYQFYSISKVSTDKFIAFYPSFSGTNGIYARVGTVSGTTITWGTSVVVAAGSYASQLSHITSARLSDNNVIVGYWFPDDIFAKVCQVSGTVITLGAAAAISVSYTVQNSYTYCPLQVVALTSTLVAFAWENKVNACTISGTTITVGTEVSVTNISTSPNNFNLIKLNSAAYALVFVTTSGTNTMRIAPFTVSGTISLAQTAYQPSTSSFSGAIGACYLSDNKFAITYSNKVVFDSTLSTGHGVAILTVDGSYNVTIQSVTSVPNLDSVPANATKLVNVGSDEFLFLGHVKHSPANTGTAGMILGIVDTYDIETFKTSFELYNKDDVSPFFTETDYTQAGVSAGDFYCLKDVAESKLYLTLKNTSAGKRFMYVSSIVAYID